MTQATAYSRRTWLRQARAVAWVWAAGAVQAGWAQTQRPQEPEASPVSLSLPAELVSEWAGMRPLGNARLRFFGLDIYEARLWVGADFKAGDFARHPLALELRYFRTLSGRAIAERSLNEMQRQGALTTEQGEKWLAAMVQAFPDVRADDRIVGAHTPGTGARFWHNGQARPAVRDGEFSRLFFGIWLSEATSEPTMRTRLLGLNP